MLYQKEAVLGNQPMHRKVWRIDKAGSLSALTQREEELADPAAGEVQVAVRCIGLNFADIFATLGLYSATPKGSFVPGLEYAGTVVKVGPQRSLPATGAKSETNAYQPQVGDEIMGVTRFGAYATHLNIDARYVYRLVPSWSMAEGAALIAQALTAWYAIASLANTQRGHTVLVHSAAGGVGLQALWMLRKLECKVAAIVGRPEKADLLAEQAGLSRQQIIVRSAKTFGADLDRVLAHLGSPGFDCILDSVAGRYFRPGLTRLQPAGRLVLFGAAEFMPTGRRPNYLRLAYQCLTRPKVDPVEMISDNRSVMAFNLIWLWDRVEELSALLADVLALGPPRPLVGHRFAFADAHEALRLFQSGRTVGKVVLDVDE